MKQISPYYQQVPLLDWIYILLVLFISLSNRSSSRARSSDGCVMKSSISKPLNNPVPSTAVRKRHICAERRQLVCRWFLWMGDIVMMGCANKDGDVYANLEHSDWAVVQECVLG
ncbi:hypothetical protein FB451DRAFT_113455 [Mycena latifolia]|nr:hypothetical protein FB451DRAFT_113455 [Mycena latifolia]